MVDQIKRYESTALKLINSKIESVNNNYNRQLEFVGYKNGIWKGRNTILLIKCNKHNLINEIPYRQLVDNRRKEHCYNFCFCKQCRKEYRSLKVRKFKTKENAIEEIKKHVEEINKEGFNISFLGFVNDEFHARMDKTKILIKCNIHNETKQVSLESFITRNTFCTKCLQRKQRLITNRQIYEELVKVDKFGYDFSKILEEPELGKSGNRHIIAICPKHGKFEQTLSSFLKDSKRPHCYHCWKEQIEQELINKTSEKEQIIRDAIKLKKEKYGYDLEFLGFVGGVYKGNTTRLILKCNTCGSTWETTLYTHFVSKETFYGCPVCSKNIYSGEEKCLNILKDTIKINNIIQQYKIDYLDPMTNSKRKMFCDFYLPDLNIIIEFNGQQHYKYTKFFWDSLSLYEKQKERDKYLIKYCQDNNIKLLIIPYLDNNKNRLEEVILKFIETGEDITTPIEPE